MATFAASVVVMKRGTATASPAEVRAAIESSGLP
jgi:bifunctional ADP-heptose synthase (sugar kinase/adenylyltransferase)